MTESQEQKALMQWWKAAHKGLGVPDARLLFSIPNGAFFGGGVAGAIRGKRMKAEGLVSGVPDLFLAIPRDVVADDVLRYSPGLFIEMKKKGGTESMAQRELRLLLKNQGYIVTVCVGWESAVTFIKAYLQYKYKE